MEAVRFRVSQGKVAVIAVTVLWIALSLRADTSVTLRVGNGSGEPGTGGYSVFLYLTNTVPVSGIQLVLGDIPDDLDVTSCRTTSRTAGFLVSSEDHGSTASLLLVSLSGTIAPGTGQVAEVVLQVHADALAGVVELQPSDVKVPDENYNLLPATTETGSFTVPVVLGITVSPTVWGIGPAGLGSIVESTTFTATNTSNATATLSIRGTDGANQWTLAAIPGANAFRVDVDRDANGVYDLILTKSEQTLTTSIIARASRRFRLKYAGPTGDTKGGGIPQDFAVTLNVSQYASP